MAHYVDAYVLPVPLAKLAEYKRMAIKAGKVWIEHGALEVREHVADDVKVGKLTSFPQSVMLEEGEVVVFSYVIFKSRKQRDAINAKVMADPRLAALFSGQMSTFDGKRMIWGGFKSMVVL